MSFANEAIQIGNIVRDYFSLHHDWVPPFILAAFVITNTVRIVAYLPQLIKAASDSNGATAISTLTWGLFLISNLMTVAYALVCLGDLLMAVLFVGNAIACLAIVVVTIVKGRRHKISNLANLRADAAARDSDNRGLMALPEVPETCAWIMRDDLNDDDGIASSRDARSCVPQARLRAGSLPEPASIRMWRRADAAAP